MKNELIYSGEAARLLDLDPQSIKQRLLGWKVKPVRLETDPASGHRSTLWRKRDVMDLMEVEKIDADIKPSWSNGKAKGRTSHVKKAAKIVKITKPHGGGHVKGAASVKNKLKRLEAIRDVMSNGDYESHRDLIIEEFLG